VKSCSLAFFANPHYPEFMENPMHPKEITAKWLDFALREGGVLKSSSVTHIDIIDMGDIHGFLSSVIKVELFYDQYEPGAPKSVVIKIEPESESFRQLGDDIHAFEREIKFYELVAKKTSIRLPHIFYAVLKPPAFSLVMEDLTHLRAGDQIPGITEEETLATVSTIARLQANFWDNELLNQLDWMPVTNAVEIDYQDKWDSFVKHFGHCTNPEALKVGERVGEYSHWLEQKIESRPRTVVHADLRADNLLFGSKDSEEEIVILDWQLAMRSMGAFDVARLMAGSEPVTERSGHHMEVVRHWHGTLLQHGVKNYAWLDALYDFKLGALATMFYPVHFHPALIGATGRDLELFYVLISRVFSCALEIDAASALPD